MRSLAVVFALVAATGLARADDARVVPEVGAALTYRALVTTTVGDRAITTGQIYTYIVATSDGAVAEGHIKPVAMIFGCRPDNVEADCILARKVADARQDADRVVIPVPNDLADHLAAQSSFRFRYFIPEMRRLPVPVPRAVDDSDHAAFGSEAAFVTTNEILCPPDALRRFLPIGRLSDTVLACQITVGRTGWPAGHAPAMDREESVKLELSYRGRDRVTLPSGEWDVQNLTYATRLAEGDRDLAATDVAFSGRLGVGVKSRVHLTPPNGPASDAISELIAVSP